MEFFTQIKTPEAKHTPAGDKYLDVFQEEITEKGTGLVAVGKTNVYDKIQEDVESTKIENVLAAVAMGDLSVLRTQEPTYIDATSLPKNLMQAQNIVLKAKQEFEKMPSEVRELFNNNPDTYIAEMGTEKYFEKMAPYNKKIADIAEAGNLKKYNEAVKRQAKFEKDVESMKGAETE